MDVGHWMTAQTNAQCVSSLRPIQGRGEIQLDPGWRAKPLAPGYLLQRLRRFFMLTSSVETLNPIPRIDGYNASCLAAKANGSLPHNLRAKK